MHASPTSALRFQAGAISSAGLTALAAAALMGPLQARAQGQPGAPGEASWGLGLGVATTQQAYREIDRDTLALPLLQFENQYVRLMGPSVEVKLPGLRISDTQRLQFGLTAKYDRSGYKAKDSPFLAGMAEREGGIWVGGQVEWINDWAKVSAKWTADASGNSKGQQFSLGLERSWRIGQQVVLSPRVVATWQDSKTVDYYYGVRASEARPGRAAYRGESGVNTELGLRSMYLFDRQHSVFLDVGVTRLNSKIKNSPLVDRSSESNVFLGYMYRFR